MIIDTQTARLRKAVSRWVPGSQKSDVASVPRHISRAVVWSASIVVILLSITIYGRSVHITPLGDDWVFLYFSWKGPAAVFGLTTNYHYNPVAQGVMYIVFLLFGTNPVPFHVVALAFFCGSVVLLQRLGWRITGSFAVGILASVLFVINGRQYEGVIWTVVAIFQTLGLLLYLAGMLFYLRAHDEQRSVYARRWDWLGFYVCMILAVFTYEQEITLVLACALYRLLVLEHGRGFDRVELMRRAREWTREFGFAALFFALYLAFKYYLGVRSGASQAPGLHTPFGPLVTTIVVGLYQAYMPGIVRPAFLLTAQQHLLMGLAWARPLWYRALHFLVVLAPIAAITAFAKPVYRWLALWSVLVVGSTVLGIGYLASRYMLLFVVPGTIIWAGFLVALTNWIRMALVRLSQQREIPRLRRAAPAMALLVPALFISAYAVLGIKYVFVQQANWQQASDIAVAIRKQLIQYAAANRGAHTLYWVNMPGSLPPPAGIFEHGAYLCWPCGLGMVVLNVPGQFDQVYEVRTANFPDDLGPVVTDAQVDAWSHQNGALVLTYDQNAGRVTTWDAAPPSSR